MAETDPGDRVSRFLDGHPEAVFWGLLIGGGIVFPEIWLALLPKGPVRSTIFVVGSLVTLIPALALLTNAYGSVDRLRRELRRRGYRGVTVEWPDYFWQSVGFGMAAIGTAFLLGGIAT